MKKKILWFLAALVALLCVLTVSASAASTVASGTCGENLTWSLDSEGMLVVDGTGSMTDDRTPGSVPWYTYRNSILSVKINPGVTSIRSYAFNGCNYLANAEIPESVTSVGESAFYACGRLTDAYYLGDLASWCNMDFGNWESTPMYGAENLYIDGVIADDLVVPYNVSTIKKYTFAYCDSLVSIKLSSGVKKIEDGAFENCTNLKNVKIPTSVTSIGEYAFFYCDSLDTIHYDGNAAQWRDIKIGQGNSFPNICLSLSVGAAVSFENGVTPEFSINGTALEGSDNYAIITAGNETVRVEQSDWVNRKVIYDGIGLKDLTQNMTIHLYNAESEPLLFEGVFLSVYNALEKRLNDETDAQKKAEYTAQLHLAAAAQKFFDYNTNNLANKDLDSTVGDMSAYRKDESFAGGKNPGIIRGTSCVLGNVPQMKIYFTANDKTVLVNGEEVELTAATTAGYYYCLVNVAPAEIFTPVIIEVKDGTETIATGTDSIASYCARLYAQGGEKNTVLADALLNYGVAAMAAEA